ncbi:hypothetical protein CVT25_004772 [Psilocybe cyanescens]|uniref:Uncharacterized protein n=1 Tax=Psilocybe cyanescens TaxID=93625 RepID=A0A409XUG8_PSICY|nr:hypothetical protein CVT25_004772 [Psilocybe cyanescens]
MLQWYISSCATAANEAVLNLKATDIDYQDADFCKEWVMWATKDCVWPFLYADVKAKNSSEWTGTFALELIIKSLAAHLAYTTNAIIIKKLKTYKAN